MLALISTFDPSIFFRVLALAGDSTITRVFPFLLFSAMISPLTL